MIRILLVDDQSIIRQGLKALLELDPDLQVVGTANNGQTAIEQVESLRPDIVLLDIRMPEMDGVTATRIISQRFSDTKIIVLSSYDDDEYLASALQAGAKGYLLKDTPAEELVNVVRNVHKGYAQLGPGLVGKISFGSASNSTDLNQLTPQSAALTPLQQVIQTQLNSFTPQAVLELVHLIIEHKAVVELFVYIDNYLKQHPDNLAALYLAGTLLARRGQEHKLLALYYLGTGFTEGIIQELPIESLLLFYREGARLESEEAFSWLTQVSNLWNSKEGLAFLLQEAESLFGANSTHCRSLLLLRQIRAIRALSDSYASLEPMLKILQQGFDRFHNVIKVKE